MPYFDNRATKEVFANYRECRSERQNLIERKDALNKAERNQLDELNAEYEDLRSKIALAAYEISERFLPRFKPAKRILCEADDLHQAAAIYIVHNAHKFDPNRGTSLLSWMTATAKNAWLMLLRQQSIQDRKFADYAASKAQPIDRHRGGHLGDDDWQPWTLSESDEE